jgi:hypothetical protein
MDEASRLDAVLETLELRGGLRWFLGERDFAALTGRDADGRL